MDEWEWVRAADNRQRVSLTTGECVTLLSWGTSQGRNRARVQFANGRQKTVSKNSVADLVD